MCKLSLRLEAEGVRSINYYPQSMGVSEQLPTQVINS